MLYHKKSLHQYYMYAGYKIVNNGTKQNEVNENPMLLTINSIFLRR